MGKLKIKWLGQSGYLLSDGKSTICIDPYLSDCVNRIASRPRVRPVPVKPGELKADAVICTHNHPDHLDMDAIPCMDKKILFLAPRDCERTLKELGVLRYRPFDEGESLGIGDFTVTARYAEHTVPAIGVTVEYSGIRLYFSGDTYYSEKLTHVQCDHLFVCINGRLGNMNIREAEQLAEKIAPRLTIPNHYDMFESNCEDPENFRVRNRFIMEFNVEYEVTETCLS